MRHYIGQISRSSVAFTVAVFGIPTFAEQAVMLKDINPADDDRGISIKGASENYLYVGGGSEDLASIDRTGQLVTPLLAQPREFSRDPSILVVGLNSVSLFPFRDSLHGRELWRSDGTRRGTHLVKDLVDGPVSGDPNTLVRLKHYVYFTTPPQDDAFELQRTAPPPPQLWRSDGTEAGTQVVTNLDTLEVFDNELGAWGRVTQMIASQDKLYFVASVRDPTEDEESVGKRWSLWQSDGTAIGTRKMVQLRDNAILPFEGLLGTVGGLLFFKTESPDDSVNGDREWRPRQLWRTDGTDAGTILLTKALAYPTIWEFNEREYFIIRADDGLYLARTNEDGSDIEAVALLRAGSTVNDRVLARGAASATSLFIEIDDYFDGGTVHALWRSGGSTQNTEKIADLPFSMDPEGMFKIKNDILYFNEGPAGESELWRSNGTAAGTGPYTTDLHLNFSYLDPNSYHFADEIWFNADEGIANKRKKLFHTTPSNSIETVNVRTNFMGGSKPRQFTPLRNGVTLFKGNTGYSDRAGIYSSRGTPETTFLHAFSTRTCFSCDFEPMIALGDGALFFATDTASLWYMGGSKDAGDAQIVMNKVYAVGHSNLPTTKNMLAPLGRNAALFLSVENKIFGQLDLKLWRTDGSVAGTTVVSAFSMPDQTSSRNYPNLAIFPHHRFAVFVGYDIQHGSELWRTDGTPSGTYMVKDIVPGSSDAEIQNVTSARDHLFFTYSDKNGTYLAKTLGTGKSTKRIARLPNQSHKPGNFTAVRDSIFFSVGHDIYRSNGRPGDLRRLDRKGESYAERRDWPFELTAFGNYLYFIARNDAASPMQIWRASTVKNHTEIVTPNFSIPVSEAKDVDFYVHGRRLFLAVMDRVGREGGIFELRTRGGSLEWFKHTDMAAKELRVASNKMYFAGLDDEFGEEPRVMPLPKQP